MKYFKYKEFKCNCCNKQEMNKQFLLFLDELRARCSFPFRVTSGWRCENKQKDLAKRGYHTINWLHLLRQLKKDDRSCCKYRSMEEREEERSKNA